MLTVEFSANALPYDDNRVQRYPKELLDLLMSDDDVVYIADEHGKVFKFV